MIIAENVKVEFILTAMQYHADGLLFNPLNIDNFIDQKLKALAAYTSQSESRPYLQEDMIIATARYWGCFGTYNLVEPMEVIKQS